MRYRSSLLASAVGAALEQLETRRMLSSTIDANKVLVITGTTGVDTISVTFESNRYVVRDNGTAIKYLLAAVKGITINTLAGNDKITLGQNFPVLLPVIIDAGVGNDSVVGSNLNDQITLGAGNDTASGNAGDDAIFAQDGNDSVAAGDGNTDRVYPGKGNDTVSGGTGTYDTVTYQDRTDGVTVRIDGLGPSGNLTTGEADTIANDFDNVVGGQGNDLLIGNAFANVVGGAKGNDTMVPGLGNDDVWGDEGIDTVDYSARTTTMKINIATGGATTTGKADKLHTLENAIGGSAHDVIIGDILANSILGGAGNDYLDGGEGNDTVEGGTGRDEILGGTGTNRIRGGSHNDTIIGGPHRDVIYGDGGDDSILAGKGNDYINGGANADSIDGGLGTDTAVDDPDDLDTIVNVETIT